MMVFTLVDTNRFAQLWECYLTQKIDFRIGGPSFQSTQFACHIQYLAAPTWNELRRDFYQGHNLVLL